MPKHISVDATQLATTITSLRSASDSVLDGVRTARANMPQCIAVPEEMSAFQSAFEMFGLGVDTAVTGTHQQVDDVRVQVQQTAETFHVLDRETATDLQSIQKAAEEVDPQRWASVVAASTSNDPGTTTADAASTDGSSSSASGTTDASPATPVSATPQGTTSTTPTSGPTAAPTSGPQF